MVSFNKNVFLRNGCECVRKGFVCRADDAEKFAQKCAKLGESETRIIERLIRCFNMATGWGMSCKQAPFFEPDANLHIKEAVETVLIKDRFM